MNTPARTWKDRALCVLSACCWLAAIAHLLSQAGGHFWDFRVYHRAAAVFVQGGDAYAAPFNVAVSGRSGMFPFVYPPGVLSVLAPLAALPESFALYVWLAFKLAAYVWLLRIWRRSFGVEVSGWAFPLFALFAFNAAAYSDLATGNIAVFEALCVFLALEHCLQDKPYSAAFLIVAIACVKIVPLAFLALIPLLARTSWRKPVACALLAFALCFAATNQLRPAQTRQWLATAASRSENRATNPTMYEFWRDVAARVPRFDHRIAYVYTAATVCLVTQTIRSQAKSAAPWKLALYLVTALSLLLPRFMLYSHLELLPAAWLAIASARGLLKLLLVLAVCVPTPASLLLYDTPALASVWDSLLGMRPETHGYLALLAVVLTWAALGFELYEAPPAARDESAP